MTRCLLLIDLQNDFLPGGSLAVPGGDQTIAVANQLMSEFDLVYATQDWHPPDHLSFASQHTDREIGEVIELDGLQQILWPDHCIQHSHGADFAPELNLPGIDRVIQKGTDRRIDSYSGFFDNARRKSTELETLLRSKSVDEIHLVGLATDYCVKFTALDAVDLGFRTVVITEGVRGVDLCAGDCEKAVEEMKSAGVVVA